MDEIAQAKANLHHARKDQQRRADAFWQSAIQAGQAAQIKAGQQQTQQAGRQDKDEQRQQ
jgi:hypothetical protein